MSTPTVTGSASAERFSDKIPVTVVTGFLGSGKTTFLNYLLETRPEMRVAVLANELGQIDIDRQLLVSETSDMVELSNGCICCSINEDLVDAIERVLERSPPMEAIVIETTGVADPRPLLVTFSGQRLRDRTRLDAIVTMVDAENFEDVKRQSEVAVNQIVYSDILVLNKVDLVASEKLENLENFLRSLKKSARILKASFGRVPLQFILDRAAPPTRKPILKNSGTGTSDVLADGFTSVSFQSDRPFLVSKFQTFLSNRLSHNVFRAKGILWFKESQRCHVFQLCGERYNMATEPWKNSPKNQLVLIGRNLDALQIQQQLTNCLAR
ncbi:Putative metal chaperone involved in Zn homeostasis GTPase of COG0523 family [Geitlerinema sp. FC II]|nr:GTP-binding protein [Geitlerinema sp. CS-897]PPT05431.1 Putative metal chaperone involved in Zn homeostasis GTPase of COG0523 family [Geitlerinema sp. FC II]